MRVDWKAARWVDCLVAELVVKKADSRVCTKVARKVDDWEFQWAEQKAVLTAARKAAPKEHHLAV